MGRPNKTKLILAWLHQIHLDTTKITRQFRTVEEFWKELVQSNVDTSSLTLNGFTKIINKIVADKIFTNFRRRITRNNQSRCIDYIILNDNETNIDIQTLKVSVSRQKINQDQVIQSKMLRNTKSNKNVTTANTNM